MIYSVRLVRLLLAVLILLILVFMGCRRGGDGEMAGADVQIALQPMPLEETMVVILTSADGAPIIDATVALEGNMNHAGMIPVLADPVADDADGSADGRYTLPFGFTMLGDWIITVTVTGADGSSFQRNLDVRAGSGGIEGNEVVPAEGATVPLAAIHVAELRARPAPLAGGTGAVYFVLHNMSNAEVTLIGAESPAAGAIELHTTINDNGVMRMRQIEEGIVLAPDEAVELAPGGMHLMLIDLAAPLVEGEKIALTLYFAGADDLTVEVPVVSMDDLPAEGEHDH